MLFLEFATEELLQNDIRTDFEVAEDLDLEALGVTVVEIYKNGKTYCVKKKSTQGNFLWLFGCFNISTQLIRRSHKISYLGSMLPNALKILFSRGSGQGCIGTTVAVLLDDEGSDLRKELYSSIM